jgi:hypothetical protein
MVAGIPAMPSNPDHPIELHDFEKDINSTPAPTTTSWPNQSTL